MKSYISIVSRILGIGIVVLGIGQLFVSPSHADIIDRIFQPSLSRDAVINQGQNKDAVGAAVFKGGVEVTIGAEDPISGKDSLLVRITKTLLRLTLILGITLTIWNGIKFVLAAGDGGKQKEAAKNIGLIALGVIIALASVGIIYLLVSVSKSIF